MPPRLPPRLPLPPLQPGGPGCRPQAATRRLRTTCPAPPPACDRSVMSHAPRLLHHQHHGYLPGSVTHAALTNHRHPQLDADAAVAAASPWGWRARMWWGCSLQPGRGVVPQRARYPPHCLAGLVAHPVQSQTAAAALAHYYHHHGVLPGPVAGSQQHYRRAAMQQRVAAQRFPHLPQHHRQHHRRPTAQMRLSLHH